MASSSSISSGEPHPPSLVFRVARAELTQLWPLGIPVLYAVVMLLVQPIHSTFNEWGGVLEYFAGRALVGGQGYQGWVSHFWPPLFPFLLGLASQVLPGFLAGKLLSILASSVLLLVTYSLAVELTQHPAVGLWSQAFLALSPTFFSQSLIVHEHMLEALLVNVGVWLFVRALANPKPAQLLICGVACGLASLSRYTSDVLLALPVVLFFARVELGRVWKLAAAFWIGFAAVALLWWYPNWVTNGSPLYQWEYLNICTGVVPGNVPGDLVSLWRCAAQSQFGSLWSLLTALPGAYIHNVARNLLDSALLVVQYGGVLAPAVIPAFFMAGLSLKDKKWVAVLGMLGLYTLVVSQAFISSWFLLAWAPVDIILAVAFVWDYLARLAEAYPFFRPPRLRDGALALLVVGGLIFPADQLRVFWSESLAGQPLAEATRVAAILNAQDTRLSNKVIMAGDPAWAYYAHAQYLSTPLDYSGNIAGLVAYAGVSQALRLYAPKFPADMPLTSLRADYLVYTDAPPDDPRFAFLLDPTSGRVPANFKSVYHSGDVAVYAIGWGGSRAP